jgi:hypothetical protein
MTPAVTQATKFAAAVNKLIPGMNVPVWDKARCKDRGYGSADAGVVLEETPFGAIDELMVEGRDTETLFTLEGMTRVPGLHAEPYASWLLLWYKD